MSITMQQKRGSTSDWSNSTLILLAGEIGFDTDTNKMKVGNGVDIWNNLEYVVGSETNDATASIGNNYEGLISIENPTIIDTVVKSEWRTLKYVISMTNSTGLSNKFETTELTVLLDASDISVSEYGVIDNNGEVGTVSVSQSGGNVNIVVTPNLTAKPITVRHYRTGLKA